MPRFDGTGPRGEGPFTGRGEGYCVVRLPDQVGENPSGYGARENLPDGRRLGGGLPTPMPPVYGHYGTRVAPGIVVRRFARGGRAWRGGHRGHRP